MVSPVQLLCFYVKKLFRGAVSCALFIGTVTLLTAATQHNTHTGDHVPVHTDSLISFALTLQGIPYKYGGKTPEGFDCSGFTGYVFRQFGIQLEASSYYQFRQGEAIVADSIQKGDLVFFRNTKDRINHVGIVSSIDSAAVLFVHASSSRGIRVDALHTPYFRQRLVGFKRILPPAAILPEAEKEES